MMTASVFALTLTLGCVAFFGAKYFILDASVIINSKEIKEWDCFDEERKRALIVTLTYENTEENELLGCTIDGDRMKNVLQDRGFKVTWLRDDLDRDHELYPTKENTEMWMKALSGSCRSEDSIFFYFSGHGNQEESDRYSAEKDKRDETICVAASRPGGEDEINDNKIHELLIKNIPLLAADVHLFAMFDCCHSQTIMDLPFHYNPDTFDKKGFETNPGRFYYPPKYAKGLRVTCLSGCEDGKSSVGRAHRASDLTRSFLKYIDCKTMKKTYSKTRCNRTFFSHLGRRIPCPARCALGILAQAVKNASSKDKAQARADFEKARWEASRKDCSACDGWGKVYEGDQYLRQDTIINDDPSLYRHQRPYIQCLTGDTSVMKLSFDELLMNRFRRSRSSNVAARPREK